jgi:hypothetical protein
MNKINESSEIFINYSASLADRIFKILPLYEEKNEGLFRYIQSLIYEFNGLVWAVESLNSNPDLLVIIATMESLSNDAIMFDEDKEVIKREVFKCIDLSKKLKSTDESGD